jgi:hypothetical protein
MRPEVATRPAGPEARTPAPAEPAVAGAPSPARPSGGGLVVEGLVVYVVFQLLTVVFLPALRSANESFYDDVLLGFFGPEKHGLAQLLREGFLPVWLDNQYGGEPVLANLQHAVLYPGNLPFWVLETSTALEVVAAVHVAVAGVFMWAYCRLGLRTGWAGAALAGLAFGFGAITLQHIILLNQLQVIAWMPLVVLFGHLALERGRWRWVVLCGVAAGLQLLAGHPEEWVYTLFALASYGLAWSLAGGLGAWPRRALQAAGRLGGAMVALGLLFAWQLGPTLVLQRQGWRTAPGFDEQYELPARLAFNALLPDFGSTLFGENVGFIGLVALGLAGLGVWAGPMWWPSSGCRPDICCWPISRWPRPPPWAPTPCWAATWAGWVPGSARVWGGWPSSGWCSASPRSWGATATGSRVAAGGWWRPRLGCWPGWRPASGPCPGC